MAQLPLMQQLEAHDNEAEVRERLASRQYHSEQVPIIQEWLRRKEEARSAASSTKRDAREEETLSIAKEALSIAKEANRIASEDLAAAQSSATSAFEQARWAKWAAIIATVAAIIATVAAMVGK
ncbi:MAG: hypothetical protein Q8Q76_08900 [Methylotenera sp.]|nr:hypothetical protein [Methylotenera sp.]